MIIHDIVLSVRQRSVTKTGIALSQGDYGKDKFLIRIEDNGNDVNDAQSAMITFATSRGRVIQGDLEKEVGSGRYAYVVKGSELQDPGEVYTVVTLVYEEGRKSSCGFSFVCKYNPLLNDVIPAGEYIAAFDKIKNDAEELIAYIQELLDTGQLKGDKGDTGQKGEKGEKGEQGVQGIQGVVGPQGPTGAAGEQGQKGETGPAGPQGIQGMPGQKGEKGDRGDSGVTVPANGFFTFAGDQNGDLWCYYSGGTAPEFEVTDNGDIYMVLGG